VNGIAAQDARMRERFIALGAPPDRVLVTGNVKFDWHPAHGASPEVHLLQKFCKKASDFLCVAGSTHEGEEEIFFTVYPSLKKSCPSFRLLIAPRHLNRLEAIEAAAAKHELTTRRVSSEDEDFENAGGKGDILLLDQMGVLPFLYAVADVVFVGGSLVPAGGHNLVEPAYYEKAILFGPYMNNFLEMAEEFKKNEAACPVNDARDLENRLLELFSSRERRQSLGKAAKRLVLHHQGAADKNKELLVGAMSRKTERKLVTA
jgi:3-deoxy-D-manno-octulosonic-acid transferase